MLGLDLQGWIYFFVGHPAQTLLFETLLFEALLFLTFKYTIAI